MFSNTAFTLIFALVVASAHAESGFLRTLQTNEEFAQCAEAGESCGRYLPCCQEDHQCVPGDFPWLYLFYCQPVRKLRGLSEHRNEDAEATKLVPRPPPVGKNVQCWESGQPCWYDLPCCNGREYCKQTNPLSWGVCTNAYARSLSEETDSSFERESLVDNESSYSLAMRTKRGSKPFPDRTESIIERVSVGDHESSPGSANKRRPIRVVGRRAEKMLPNKPLKCAKENASCWTMDCCDGLVCSPHSMTKFRCEPKEGLEVEP